MNEEADERSRKSSTQFGHCHQRNQNHQRAGNNRTLKNARRIDNYRTQRDNKIE